MDGALERIGARVEFNAAPYGMHSAAKIIYGEGAPGQNIEQAAVGVLYIDRANGNRTYRRVAKGWNAVE